MSFLKIKKLIQEYYRLKPRVLIKNHDELIFLFVYKGKDVVISRRSLKHFVERRKEDLGKHHSNKAVLRMIDFIIKNIKRTVTDSDSYKQDRKSHVYVKDYSSLGKPRIRIVLEEKNSHLEIKSIHFRKYKKTAA